MGYYPWYGQICQIFLSLKYELWWHYLKGLFLDFQKIIKLLKLDQWNSSYGSWKTSCKIYQCLLCCSFPVPLSLACTLTIPLASMSKVTSTWGIPLGAGGIPTSWNLPRTLLSLAISLSPWHTTISTEVCPSAAVEKTWNMHTVHYHGSRSHKHRYYRVDLG